MLFAVDIGNTNIVYGLFREDSLIRTWRVPTDKLKIPDINFNITEIIISSVVPKVEAKLKKYLARYFKVKPVFVNASNVPIKVKLKDKKAIGADRLVNAYAARKLYGAPVIVVDFGTATTFDVVNAKGEYEGGIIAPGIILARDALYHRTAKLPKIKIAAPRKVVGKDTVSAMQSGLVYGYAAMVEGMVGRIRNSEFGIRNCRVVATGGLAGLICKHARVIDRIDPDLTLKGLNLLRSR